MTVPNYIVEMPWFREMSRYGQLLFFDVLRLVHLQYNGCDVDLQEPRGILVSYDRCKVNLSPELFRKARKELCVHGILAVCKKDEYGNDGRQKKFRDAYMFHLPS